MPLGLVAAGLLSKTIDKILEWYLRVLEIRKRRQELQDLGAPVAEANAIKKHERELLDKEIRSLAVELVKEVHQKVDAPRRNELETHLIVSIRQIAKFVDKGGTVEIDSAPPEDPEEHAAPAEGSDVEATDAYARRKKDFDRLSSEVESVSKILRGGIALRRLPDRPEPILQLTDGEAGEEVPEPDKPKKKT